MGERRGSASRTRRAGLVVLLAGLSLPASADQTWLHPVLPEAVVKAAPPVRRGSRTVRPAPIGARAAFPHGTLGRQLVRRADDGGALPRAGPPRPAGTDRPLVREARGGAAAAAHLREGGRAGDAAGSDVDGAGARDARGPSRAGGQDRRGGRARYSAQGGRRGGGPRREGREEAVEEGRASRRGGERAGLRGDRGAAALGGDARPRRRTGRAAGPAAGDRRRRSAPPPARGGLAARLGPRRRAARPGRRREGAPSGRRRARRRRGRRGGERLPLPRAGRAAPPLDRLRAAYREGRPRPGGNLEEGRLGGPPHHARAPRPAEGPGSEADGGPEEEGHAEVPKPKPR
jgi:hypothetical protein